MRFGNDSFGFVLNLLLLCALALGSNACAQSETQKAEDSQQHQRKSNELRVKGELQAALAEQEKAIALTPNDAQAQLILASIYDEQYDETKNKQLLEKAKAALEKVIILKPKPNNAAAHDLLGAVFDKLGNKQASLEERKIAAQLSPNNLNYLTNVGVQHYSLNENELARKHYESVLKLNPNFIYALFHYGRLETEFGDKQKALQLFKRALAAKPTESNDEYYQDLTKKKIAEIEAK